MNVSIMYYSKQQNENPIGETIHWRGQDYIGETPKPPNTLELGESIKEVKFKSNKSIGKGKIILCSGKRYGFIYRSLD